MTRPYIAAIVTTAALLIAACGSSDDSSTSSTTPSGNAVDRAFVAQMIPHHQSAVQMANIAKRRGTSTFVTQLATSIARAQTAEIATMRAADQRLRKAGVKRGSLGVPDHLMGMGGDVASLNGARPFDTAFMRMMLPHHQGAVTMADSELENGGDPKLKKLAHTIISAQQREIGEMRRHLARRPKMSSGEHMRGSGSMHDTGHAG